MEFCPITYPAFQNRGGIPLSLRKEPDHVLLAPKTSKNGFGGSPGGSSFQLIEISAARVANIPPLRLLFMLRTGSGSP